MKEYEYTVIFEPAEEGGWLAHIPALNGLTTQGETMEETEEMAEDAIKCYIETCVENGFPIPDDTIEGRSVVRKMSVAI